MDDTAGIYSRQVEALDRYVQIGTAQGRLLSVEFPVTVDDPDPAHGLLDRIEAYLGGEADEFRDVQVAMTMPTDQREVLEAAREIPYGETTTVEQLTRMVPGRDPDEGDDLTAVGDALSSNPAPILIPTHRVSDGPDGVPSDVAAALRAVEGL